MPSKKQNQDALELTDEMRRLYDAFMFQVEPDLMSYSVSHLEEIYLDETEEEHDVRMSRYADAFEMFVAFLDDAGKIAERYFLGLKKEAMSAYAKDIGSSEKNAIESIEKAICDDTSQNI